MAWTDERVELLKKLWAEGLSASQIAQRLGNVTRNAVIGKVHRLGLSGRTTTSRPKTSRPRRRTASRTGAAARSAPAFRTQGGAALQAWHDTDAEAEPVPRTKPVEEVVIPIAERASILTLKENMCRWPIGDPAEEDFHFCGRPSGQGTPYCEVHERVAYQPPQTRRRDSKAAAE